MYNCPNCDRGLVWKTKEFCTNCGGTGELSELTDTTMADEKEVTPEVETPEVETPEEEAAEEALETTDEALT